MLANNEKCSVQRSTQALDTKSQSHDVVIFSTLHQLQGDAGSGIFPEMYYTLYHSILEVSKNSYACTMQKKVRKK